MTVADVVAIDGPSGSGKGTIAAALAKRLGWNLLDSGALYRVVAWAALRQKIQFEDGKALGVMARGLEIEFAPDGTVCVDGHAVTDAIRVDAVSAAASTVAAHPEVRVALMHVQHGMRRAPGLVADGRDMGTIVFPDARLKIFLDATVEERARRRYKQLKDKGLSVSLRDLFASIRERDERDRTRVVSPLQPASDAVLIDSTTMSIEEVLAEIVGLIRDRGWGSD
ncbi:MAG: (d)CMP kinase [Gammaproteobacteria bacterium]|nr:(d)CMP kinase [Gammaproteobacteria bacterium]